ncbi:CCR4-NOT core subunit CDC39 [Nakaseomyces bracarensis]|uniref:CCR4-NOT core subunit CDC39 n=1 Tax=Nakaseomyces bracarensis TaxID=273131 RepID=UPI00387227A4
MPSGQLNILQEEKKRHRIAIARVIYILGDINTKNLEEYHSEIIEITEHSSPVVEIEFLKRLLLKLASGEDLDPTTYKLLLSQELERLSLKDQGYLDILRSTVLENREFLEEANIGPIESHIDQEILLKKKLQFSRIFNIDKQLELAETSNMNYNEQLRNILQSDSAPTDFTKLLVDIFLALEGESLNDCVALLLSEVLSPGSQNLQKLDKLQQENGTWFSPSNIKEASAIGKDIHDTLSGLAKDAINWNRIFNLMSTKYFLSTPVKASTASLSSLFTVLNNGPVIDEFFNCDWHVSVKLQLVVLLHKWSVPDGCFDLLKADGIKKVSNKVENTKNSLMYLKCVSSLDLELFLQRDELVDNSMLPTFQECFFQDFSSAPEYLTLALINNMKHFSLLIENTNTIDEIMVALVVQVFEKSTNSLVDIIKSLANDQKLLLEVSAAIITTNKFKLIDFANILKNENKLDFVIDHTPFDDIFKFLPRAIRVGWTGFKDYINKHLDSNNSHTVIAYLDAQIKIPDTDMPLKKSQSFDLKSLHILINFLRTIPLNANDQLLFEKLQFSLIIAVPRLINFGYDHDNVILTSEDTGPVNSDIEKEMQLQLQKMYSGEIAIKDVIDLLIKLRDSDAAHDQDLFACITHAVLSESNFYKDYPLDALATTSVLFGSMILFQLLRGFVLDVAFKIIMNFAKEGIDSKMFKFAVQAIYAFRIRLPDFPQYCKDLLQEVPDLKTQPQVYQSLSEAAHAIDVTKPPGNDTSKQPLELYPLKFFAVDELKYQYQQESPPKDLTEKVLFILNNISTDNLKNKVLDLKTILTSNYYAWFSNYLVNQRAKTEPNYHTLYKDVLVNVESEALHQYVINMTLKQLFLLMSIKDTKSIDKKHLKNLSTWLGCITLGVDKPIKHKNIAFRELLLDAHKENRLEIVVPFVTKILQNANESKIFRPPNPWTVGILRVLAELNEKANWKLSLTFEVEVLFKTLKLSLKDIQPTNYLENSDIIETLTGNVGSVTIEQQQVEHQRQMAMMQQHQQQMVIYQQRQQHMLNTTNSVKEPTNFGENYNQNEGPFVSLSGSTLFTTRPDIKRVFQIALAKAVREVLGPVVEKSANIAVITTTKIVLKDFATEADENKLKAAAITIVRQLAKSLSRATAIDPLKESLRSTTQSLLPNMMGLSANPLEDLDIAINDNIGLALNLVELAAMDKATQELGEQMIQAIAIRRYHKERRSDQPFVTPSTNPYSLALPDPLGIKNTGVTPQQFKLYEEFGAPVPENNINTLNQNPQLNTPQPVQSETNQNFQQNLPPNNTRTNVPATQGQMPIRSPHVVNNVQAELEQNHKILVHLMDSLVALIKDNSDKNTIKELGEKNQINAIIFQILTFIAKSVQKDQLALKVAQAVVNSLFATSESPLCREVLSLLLEKLCSLSLVARKDVVWWLVYALDSRKFNLAVIKSLLEVNLIDPYELDTVLVKAMNSGMENSIDFSIKLVENTVLSDNPILMRMDLINTINYLSKLDLPEAKEFFTNYENNKILPVAGNVKITKKEMYFLVFTEWVKLLQRVESNDEITLAFIQQMMNNKILSDSDNVIEFFKAALELSIFSFKESDPTGDVFISIDALSKLVIKLLIYQNYDECSRATYLNMIFTVVVLVFSKDHCEENTTFNERPYFRLLSNLLYDWSQIRSHSFLKVKENVLRKDLEKFDGEFYNIFASYLHSLQPFSFVGFSFAWVTLLSHRMFLPVMLNLPEKAGWKNLIILIIDLLLFLDKYTKKNSVSDAISVIYKGALRIILGISNDCPEFLIENHYELINAVPPTYFQLKNVILSTIPSNMTVPNPFEKMIFMKDMPECQTVPSIFYDPVADLRSLKKPVDNYLRIPSNSLLRNIMSGLHNDEKYMRNCVGYECVTVNQKFIRALVLHTGIEAGLENEKTSSNAIFNTKSSYYTLLFSIMHEGSLEIKYQVIQAIIEQLRYPNIHTYWFSFVIEEMFTSTKWGEQLDVVQEIILRALLERLVVNRPHAWGVTVMMRTLVNHKDINLLELNCVKKIPEIELIFRQVVKHSEGAVVMENASTEAQLQQHPINA